MILLKSVLTYVIIETKNVIMTTHVDYLIFYKISVVYKSQAFICIKKFLAAEMKKLN